MDTARTGFSTSSRSLALCPCLETIPFTLQLAERKYAKQLFEREGLDETARPVLVNPAAAKTPRAWSSERFQQLAELIADRHPGLPVLVHDHHPFKAAKDWPSHPSIRMLAGASLLELGAVVERCGLYVGNDSGPMHMAAALGDSHGWYLWPVESEPHVATWIGGGAAHCRLGVSSMLALQRAVFRGVSRAPDRGWTPPLSRQGCGRDGG